MTRPLRTWLLAYAVAAVVFAVIDVVWITTVANNQYQREIPHLLAPGLNLGAGAVFYLAFVVGIVHFGVRPLDPDASLRHRVGGAALFGFLSYATWALTALAVLDRFPAIVAVTDIAWGTAVCAVDTLVTVTLLRRFRGRRTA